MDWHKKKQKHVFFFYKETVCTSERFRTVVLLVTPTTAWMDQADQSCFGWKQQPEVPWNIMWWYIYILCIGSKSSWLIILENDKFCFQGYLKIDLDINRQASFQESQPFFRFCRLLPKSNQNFVQPILPCFLADSKKYLEKNIEICAPICVKPTEG